MEVRSDLVSTATAARRCGIGISTLHRYVSIGRIAPAMRVPGNGALLFTPEDVQTLREELKSEALARFDEAAS